MRVAIPRRQMQALGVLLLLVAGCSAEGASEPARRVTIAIHERVRDLIEADGIPLTTRQRESGFYIDPDRTDDSSPFTLEGLIALTFEDGAQGFTLPPGRSLIVSQRAGIVQDFTMTLFDEPKPFDAARGFVRDFIDRLDRAGWHPDGAMHVPAAPADLDRNGTWTIIAQMTDKGGNTVEIDMIDYGLAPKKESWITVPLGRSDRPSHSFLVQVSVDPPSSAIPGYGESIYPRRLFVSGNVRDALPLRAWIDDPDWSPAAHGMMPVPAAERKGESPAWRMPAKR